MCLCVCLSLSSFYLSNILIFSNTNHPKLFCIYWQIERYWYTKIIRFLHKKGAIRTLDILLDKEIIKNQVWGGMGKYPPPPLISIRLKYIKRLSSAKLKMCMCQLFKYNPPSPYSLTLVKNVKGAKNSLILLISRMSLFLI